MKLFLCGLLLVGCYRQEAVAPVVTEKVIVKEIYVVTPIVSQETKEEKKEVKAEETKPSVPISNPVPNTQIQIVMNNVGEVNNKPDLMDKTIEAASNGVGKIWDGSKELYEKATSDESQSKVSNAIVAAKKKVGELTDQVKEKLSK